ncbi:MAG: flagellar assembly protein FliW [Candidatus Zixiibacteriota bacterium]
MKITTLKFGELEIPDDKIITMPKPVLGFESLSKYCIVERDDCRPFLWYQSIEKPEVTFIICNPMIFSPEYRIEVNPKELEELGIEEVEAVEIYSIVTVPENPEEMSINLQGPIVINTRNRLAKQLVLVNSNYKVKHYLMDLPLMKEGNLIEREEESVLAV